ncbi:hypothetical protein [Aurantiacibacter spongiae]|uniref:Uncharacterized protein n=1 Tax=Aurantiacibacter spongiae TaxID=2488860 RepID=A0A3N5CQK1_9SPHN|nr:hypothetical protein [Aurantiacibacter spongiae]RPF71343.1 hypothetical protein EG799_06755 [Aurantiacibacter spongiae]
MFEGKQPEAAHSRESVGPDAGRESLRRVTWSDLVSRLAAARELRAELASASGGRKTDPASFDAAFARHIAALGEPHAGSTGHVVRRPEKQDVNPNGLGNGKCQRRKTGRVEGPDAGPRADRDQTASRGST